VVNPIINLQCWRLSAAWLSGSASFVHASELHHGARDFRDGTTNDHQAEDAQQNVEETLYDTSVVYIYYRYISLAMEDAGIK